tara:strand:+ start:1298 stop:2854 length:1557 start_codon:yes stop_codon:yes gene_type:complete
MKKIYNLWNFIINFKINVLNLLLINKKNLLLFAVSLIYISSYSQNFVSTTPENKKVILEEFTGISCGYCPDGHLIASQIHDNNPGNAFIIAIHAGSFASPQGAGTDFRTTFGTNIDSYWGISGYPAGTVNREGGSMGRSAWTGAANQILAQPSPVNVGIQANIDVTNTLIVDIEVYYTGSQTVTTNQLNVAIVQNNVEGPQSGSSGNPSQVLPNGNYNHQHMLRHLMTGQWGETISTITQGTLFANQYTWQLPADINGVALDPLNLSVVAFVSEDNENILSGNERTANVIGWVAPSWDCTGGACIDPGTGNGQYGSEQQCINNCNITPTWKCKGGFDGDPGQGDCYNPGNGTGSFTDSLSCEQQCMKNSYNCTTTPAGVIACVNPGNETGTFPTLIGCQFVCGVSASWNCEDGYCEDPGDGSGTYTNVNSCINSGCLPPTDIEDINYLNVSVFPNPVSDILTINGEYSEVNIFDLYGKLVFSSSAKETIDISGLTNGIYFVRINNNKALSINKIIINH